MRLVVGRLVDDGGGIEHHDIGKIALRQPPTLMQLQLLGGQACEAVNGLFERNYRLLPHILSKEAVEGDIGAGMGVAFKADALGRNNDPVESDNRQGTADVAAAFLFGLQKIKYIATAVFLTVQY